MKPQSCVAFNPEALHNSNEELHHSHITVRKGGNRKNQSFFKTEQTHTVRLFCLPLLSARVAVKIDRCKDVHVIFKTITQLRRRITSFSHSIQVVILTELEYTRS